MFSKHKSVEDFYFSNMKLKLDSIQKELRHQRADNALILSQINKLFVELDLQQQADSYYQEKLDDQRTTSPQTDLVQDPDYKRE